MASNIETNPIEDNTDNDIELITVSMSNIAINKGTGAGGANTNYNGKNFEKKQIINQDY